MNRQEHLLTILAEELGETATEFLDLQKQISKALRFGVHEQRDLTTSNLERMFKEYNEILAMAEMVSDSIVKTSNGITFTDKGALYRDEELVAAKKAKVEKYLLYSKECGTLTP